MIKLTKSDKPAVLENNAQNWTEELLAALADQNDERVKTLMRRYNHHEVKTALKAETKEKCAYCEARVTDVAHGDIEHVTPKSIEIERTYDWNNLTFACQICNQNKSNKENIIDPYESNPEDHLFFAGAFAKGKTLAGTRSVLELKLNRTALVESRNREIERYADQIEKIFLVEDKRTRVLLIRGMLDELDTGRPEFVAACRVVLRQYTAGQAA
ncbi:HNH endonuclease [Roseovarius sp. A-2]|uniref:HNH endonuclease n=1 Tax=Roseovarius sp. A-2 TaxID=1570360 RepID=UPI0009B571F2|nr:HNH endonuclease signature motif containing protein [Roseovarius sp. A-2]GAW33659.1 HNH endonuclease [Roseovarius sp. A-2]